VPATTPQSPTIRALLAAIQCLPAPMIADIRARMERHAETLAAQLAAQDTYARPDTGGPFVWPLDVDTADIMPRVEWREARSEQTDLEPRRDGPIVVQVHDEATALIEHLVTEYGLVGPRTELRPMATDERDILDRIDDATLCTECRHPLGGSVSDEFCGPGCQQAWYARRTVPLPPSPDPWRTWADGVPYGDLDLADSQPTGELGVAEVNEPCPCGCDERRAQMLSEVTPF